MPNETKKTALVVSGGGAKGAFAVGAIDVLIHEKNLTFDIIAGTSTGSLIAGVMAGGAQRQLRTLYTNMVTEHFLKKENTLLSVLTTNSVFDVGPFRNVLQTQMDQTRSSQAIGGNVRIFLTTVSLQTGELVYFYAGRPTEKPKTYPKARLVEIKTRKQLLKAMEASSNQPVFMSPVPVPDIPHPPKSHPNLREREQFVDGGVREYAPIRIALENGATEVWAILLGPPLEKKDPEDKQFRNAIDILQRTLDLFMTDIGENDVDVTRFVAREKNATVRILRPGKSLPTGSLSVRKSNQRLMVDMGETAARGSWTKL